MTRIALTLAALLATLLAFAAPANARDVKGKHVPVSGPCARMQATEDPAATDCTVHQKFCLRVRGKEVDVFLCNRPPRARHHRMRRCYHPDFRDRHPVRCERWLERHGEDAR